jgi:S-adenosyl methyltransferase
VGVILASAPEPETILKHPETARLIDLGRPVGIVTMALVHFFLLAQYEPMLAAFCNAVAPGSYSAMAYGTRDGKTTDVVKRTEKAYAMTPMPLYLRPKAETEPIFQGLQWWNQGL